MIVCSCNVLSEIAVRAACREDEGPRTPGQVYRCLGCSPQCGRCARTIKSILDQAGAPCPLAHVPGKWEPVFQEDHAVSTSCGTCADAAQPERVLAGSGFDAGYDAAAAPLSEAAE
jgi:bacterioferritin-associated ferredoxin